MEGKVEKSISYGPDIFKQMANVADNHVIKVTTPFKRADQEPIVIFVERNEFSSLITMREKQETLDQEAYASMPYPDMTRRLRQLSVAVDGDCNLCVMCDEGHVFSSFHSLLQAIIILSNPPE